MFLYYAQVQERLFNWNAKILIVLNNKINIMKTKIRENKKALSEIVAYVLLIVIAISLSLVVYAWLKGYILKPEEKCSDGVSLSLEKYSCQNKIINITLKNNGFFNVEGFIVRATNQTKGNAIYILMNGNQIENYFLNEKKALAPGEEYNSIFNYSKLNLVTKIEVQPVEIEGNKEPIVCSNAIIQLNVDCN